MTIGIYRIDGPNSKVYIGSSTHIENRWRKHRSLLNKNQHDNPKLQHAWNKYGRNAFKFSILEVVRNPHKLLYYEQIWLDILFTSLDERNEILNILRFAGNTLGRKYTEESRINISKGRKGIKPIRDLVAYSKAQSLAQMRSNVKRNGFYAFVSPDGTIYQDIFNLKEFATIHSLQRSNLLHVARGKRKSHKGWKKFEAKE